VLEFAKLLFKAITKPFPSLFLTSHQWTLHIFTPLESKQIKHSKNVSGIKFLQVWKYTLTPWSYRNCGKGCIVDFWTSGIFLFGDWNKIAASL